MLSTALLFAGSFVLDDMKKWPTGVTSRFWLAEVGSVAVYDKYHVAHAVGNDCILMCGHVVQDKFCVGHGFLGGFGLRRCDRT